jgi:hypothetical protein
MFIIADDGIGNMYITTAPTSPCVTFNLFIVR